MADAKNKDQEPEVKPEAPPTEEPKSEAATPPTEGFGAEMFAHLNALPAIHPNTNLTIVNLTQYEADQALITSQREELEALQAKTYQDSETIQNLTLKVDAYEAIPAAQRIELNEQELRGWQTWDKNFEDFWRTAPLNQAEHEALKAGHARIKSLVMAAIEKPETEEAEV